MVVRPGSRTPAARDRQTARSMTVPSP
jgi:hypothetical protein